MTDSEFRIGFISRDGWSLIGDYCSVSGRSKSQMPQLDVPIVDMTEMDDERYGKLSRIIQRNLMYPGDKEKGVYNVLRAARRLRAKVICDKDGNDEDRD